VSIISLEQSGCAGREFSQARDTYRVVLRKPVLMLFCSLCVLGAHLVLSPTLARAEFTHTFVTQIGGPGPGEPFARPWSLAFNSAGNLFAADPGNSIVDVFGPDNALRARIGGGILSGGFTRGVAVDDQSGSVYVGDSNLSEVFAFGPVGSSVEESYSLLSRWREAPFGNGCCFLYAAVDNHLPGPADERAGDVYVLSSAGIVYVVKPEGAGEGKVVGELVVPGAGANGGIAVDSATGNVYVANAATHSVQVFDDKGEEQPLKTITGAETPGGGESFTPIAVAVDDGGGEEAIYVVDEASKVVDEFALAGVWRGQIKRVGSGKLLQEPLAVAVQEHPGATQGQVYVADGAAQVVDVFGSAGIVLADVVTGPAESVTPTSATLTGSVNPVEEAVSACRFEYRTSQEASFLHSAACSPEPGAGNTAVPVSVSLSGLLSSTIYHYRLSATNVSGTAYGEEETLLTPGAPQIRNQVAEVISTEKAGQTSATLRAEINPGGREASYRFEYGEGTSYGTVVPVPDGTLSPVDEFLPVAAAELSGLSVGTTYHYRVVATNEFGTVDGPDRQFTTLAAALVEGYANNIGATSATLGAQIDPLGSDTSYYFEYGREACATAAQPCAQAPAAPGEDIGAGEGEVTVAPHQIWELTPNTAYHYRVVASNGLGVVHGADRTFQTASLEASFKLPDGRGWELVSPANKHSGYIRPLILEDDVQAAPNGETLTFLSEQSLFSDAQGSAVIDQVLARRSATGWESEDVATPHNAPPGQGVGQGQEFRLFSTDLSLALVQPFGAFTALSPEATERTPYIRDNTTGRYRPLLTAANVAPGTKFGGDPAESTLPAPVDVVDASPNLGHVVVRAAGVALTGASGTDGLYEWSAGQLQLVSVLPEAEGGKPAEPPFDIGDRGQNVQHAISDDGSRVIWATTAFGSPSGHIYVRDTARKKTLKLDAVQSGSGQGPTEPRFQTASADGSKVFFTDTQRLTGDSGAGSGKPDLYECEIGETAGGPTCALTDLTPAPAATESAEVVALLGASEDASYIYFIAHAALAENESAGTTEKALAGEDKFNLYVRRNDGPEPKTTFIAGVSAQDVASAERILTARVSPSGRYLAFMSNRSLTGYDNRDASSGQPDEEVFLYKAGASPQLVCASCNPTHGRPAGIFESGKPRLPVQNVVDSPETWRESWLAATVPTREFFAGQEARYQPRYLSDSGRLFFNSPDALVPQDGNGQWDAYQYEPAAIGGCTTASETFRAQTGGCVNLISPGRSSQESAFLAASESGGDVFFLTAEKLTGQDTDEQLDVYDAHDCSLSPCITASGGGTSGTCTSGETCRSSSVVEQSIFGAPGSTTLSGNGNLRSVAVPPAKPKTRAERLASSLKKCKKRPKRQRARCRAVALRRYGAHKTRSRHSRKAGR
jgi:DNA-binding beta-propeller fold protein YncE